MEVGIELPAGIPTASFQRRGGFRLGNLAINRDTFQGFVDDEDLDLSVKEFDLLVLLAERPDSIVAFGEIYERLWPGTGSQYSRSLAVVVFRLRAKMQRSSPYQIRSARSRGYGLIAVRQPAREDHD